MLRTRPAARLRAATVLIAALAATLVIGPAAASANTDRELTVMTQNLYLGSSLTPATSATDQASFIGAVGQIYATVLFTDYPTRADEIADQIQAKSPDLIGLQEVTKWTVQGIASAPPGFDFLQILQSELNSRGLNYSVAASVDNADIGPAPLALPSFGPYSCPVFAGPTFTCSVRLQDRDVILVNDDTAGLTWDNPQTGRFAAQTVINSPVGPLSFDRGWTSIDARLDGQAFKFVNSHFETEDDASTQEAQAREFLAGPAKGGTVIATGDFNSASDGSTTTSYAQLTAPGQFNDLAANVGNTCCQNSTVPGLAPGTLTNPVPNLSTRIDLILGRGAARGSGTPQVIGATPFQGTPPLYPSDHAGVVAQVRLNG